MIDFLLGVPGKLKTISDYLTTYWTAARAAQLDLIDATVSSRASASALATTQSSLLALGKGMPMIFTSNGTFTPPAPGTKVFVLCIGGGGGGGQVGDVANGAAGGTSSFGALCSATGGSGGLRGSSGGTGGTGHQSGQRATAYVSTYQSSVGGLGGVGVFGFGSGGHGAHGYSGATEYGGGGGGSGNVTTYSGVISAAQTVTVGAAGTSYGSAAAKGAVFVWYD